MDEELLTNTGWNVGDVGWQQQIYKFLYSLPDKALADVTKNAVAFCGARLAGYKRGGDILSPELVNEGIKKVCDLIKESATYHGDTHE